jgi:hypothetical protein
MKKTTRFLAPLLPFLLLSSCVILSAQTPINAELHAQFDQIGKAQRPNTIPNFDTRYEGVLGSRFTIEAYNKGEIWLTDGRHFTTELQYRFDDLENSIQVKYPEGKELLLFNNYVLKCHISQKDTTIIYLKALIEGEKDVHKLYQVLHEGKKYTLLKLPTRKIVRVDEKTALTIGRLYDQITPVFHYYFKTNDAVFKEIKPRKKDILKVLPSEKKRLEYLFKTPRYEGDLDDKKLIALFQYLEEH